MAFIDYENDGGLGDNGSESSWSAYSYSVIYEECPEKSVEEARYIIENVAPLYSYGDKIYLEVFLPFLLGIGIIGNVMFLFVVCSMRSMRTATNWCLANLAIADLIFLGFGIGEKLWMYHHSPFVNDRLSFGQYGCPIIIAFIDASYLAALFMVTSVSVERYYAVCRTQSARTNARKSSFLALVVLSWIVSVAIAAAFVPASIQMFIGCRVWPDVEPFANLPMYRGTCEAPPHLVRYPVYVNTFRTVPYFLLLVLNIWLYVSIVVSMTRTAQETRIAGRVDINLAQRNQVARMLIINGVIFFVCLVPFELFCLIEAANMLHPDNQIVPERIVTPLRYVSQSMSYINNVVNPLIYVGMSKRYRVAFHSAILCRPVVTHTPGAKTRTQSSTTSSTIFSTRSNITANML